MNLCDRCPDRGMCCRYIELPTSQHRRPLAKDEVRWINLHPGFNASPDGMIEISTEAMDQLRTIGAATTMRFDIACSALTSEGLCSLYGTIERPAMCDRWPDAPGQAPTGCLYNDALIGVS